MFGVNNEWISLFVLTYFKLHNVCFFLIVVCTYVDQTTSVKNHKLYVCRGCAVYVSLRCKSIISGETYVRTELYTDRAALTGGDASYRM